MLVSHSHQFIYTKTVKTAGTSVESYFERFCMPEGEWSLSHARDEYESDHGIIGFRGSTKKPDSCKYWNHMPAIKIRDAIGKRNWKNYHKFCVVRNPYDKVVSWFYFLQRQKDKLNESFDLDKERQEFEDWLVRGKQLPIDRDKYLIKGKFCLDDVIRFESMAVDIERICDQLGVPWEPSALPFLKKGIRPQQATIEELYSEKSKEIVKEAFSFELKHFNYAFPYSD